MSFCSALWILLVSGKLILLTAGSVIKRQEHSNDVLSLNCEAFQKAKRQNNLESMEWKVESTSIAEYHKGQRLSLNGGVRESLELKGIKVLNISRSNGALSITRLSPTNTARPSVNFLCIVRTSNNKVHTNSVTVDFSVKCQRTTPSTPSTPSTPYPTITRPALQGNDSVPKVQTESGAVVGKIETLPLGKSVYKYLGIPYAEPPVGKLRFAAPKPAKPWSGIKEAKEFGAACPQPHFPFLPSKDVEENEDCLYLNVFVPSTIKPDDKLAVMVWIHGGGFVIGSSTEYPGHMLAAFNDVIVVTFNYRLGILGFLSIPGNHVKGNYGMFDQILALKWVQTNIASFGGDPNKVTVFGECAGGMSVALHLISPKSGDLFQKVIMQSGAASSPYLALGKDASVESAVKTFATAANCPSNKTLIDCLSGKSAEEIISLQANLSMRDMKELTSPIVDGDFIPDSPQKLYKEGKFTPNVAVITGFTTHEASLGVVRMPGNASRDGVSKELFEANVTSTLKDGGIEIKMVEELVRHQYTDHSHPHNNITARERMIDFQNDFMVVAPMIFEAKALAKAGKQTYLYVFEHRPDFSPFPEWAGAFHGVDIGFVFGAPFRNVSSLLEFFTPKYSDIEKGFSWYIMKLWTDFAKFGSPTPSDSSSPIKWLPFTAEEQFYLALDVKPRLKQRYRAKEVEFWNSIIIPKVTKQAKRRKGRQ